MLLRGCHLTEIQGLGIPPIPRRLHRKSLDRATHFDVFQFHFPPLRHRDGDLFRGGHLHIFAGHFDAQIFQLNFRAGFNDQHRALQ